MLIKVLSGGAYMSDNWTEMSQEQSFFAVFCIEALADELKTSGDKIYCMLTDDSDILDRYIIPN